MDIDSAIERSARIIERLEHAQAQTWWLPDGAQLYETDDACAYFSGGQFNIVRFQPSPENVRARLNALCERIGDVPATFHFFPTDMMNLCVMH